MDELGATLGNLVSQRWIHLLAVVMIVILIAPGSGRPEIVALLEQAQVAVRSGHSQAALQSLEQILEAVPEAHDLLPLAAEAALRSGSYEQAGTYLTLIDQVEEGEPADSCAWARVQIGLGQMRSAGTYLERSPICPSALDELGRLARIGFEEGDWAMADETAALALEHGSNDPHLEFLRIELLAVSEPEAALAELREFVQVLPEADPLAYDLLDAIRESQASSEPAFRLASVGQAFARHGEWLLARSAFEKAAKLDPDYTQARAYLGLSIERIGGDGRSVILEAFQRDPYHPLPLLFLGNLLLEQGQARPARSLIERAVGLTENDPVMLVQLAAAQASDGDLSAAQGSLLDAARLAPEEPGFWLALAQFSITWEIELEDLGTVSSRQALLLDPESAQAAALLGYAHLLVGDTSLAHRLLEQSVHADPTSASTWYQLGLASLDLGDTAAARSALEHAQAVQPPSGTTELARRALDQLPEP